MTATTFKQFRRFTTDAYGLERSLRFIQAFLHVLLALAASHKSIFTRISTVSVDHEILRGFAELRTLLGLVRRFFRFFRFFDAFANSYAIFINIMKPERKSTEPDYFLLRTLDALSGTFNGIYLLLEAITLPDVLRMPGLAILGPEMEQYFKIESQRCWFLALVCTALACLIRINNLRGQPRRQEVNAEPVKEDSSSKRRHGKVKFTEKEKDDEEVERARVSELKRRLTRKMVASTLDLALPGSVIGWVPAPAAVVGGIMLTTSYLTGLDVWERCGRES